MDPDKSNKGDGSKYLESFRQSLPVTKGCSALHGLLFDYFVERTESVRRLK